MMAQELVDRLKATKKNLKGNTIAKARAVFHSFNRRLRNDSIFTLMSQNQMHKHRV